MFSQALTSLRLSTEQCRIDIPVRSTTAETGSGSPLSRIPLRYKCTALRCWKISLVSPPIQHRKATIHPFFSHQHTKCPHAHPSGKSIHCRLTRQPTPGCKSGAGLPVCQSSFEYLESELAQHSRQRDFHWTNFLAASVQGAGVW